MVKIILPPPSGKPKPQFYPLKKGTQLVRIFLPEFHATPLAFRFWGPLHRFDHHRGNPPRLKYNEDKCEPCPDPERGIHYVAFTLSSCLVEVFGDTGSVEITEHKIAIFTPNRNLKLLDVRNNAAMLAGANEATLAKTEKRPVSQAWSRYFYEQKKYYPDIQGIIYCNAHNNEEAIAIYERAQHLFTCSSKDVLPLQHESLRGVLLKAANENNLRVVPYWLEDTHVQDSDQVIRTCANTAREK